MATSFANLKSKLDIPVWQQLNLIYTAAQAAITAGAGSCLIDDKRCSQYANSNVWYLQAATVLAQYSTTRNGWLQLASPALAGTFGAGATGVFAPSQGPRGTIAAGATTSSVVISTALPAAVGLNQLKGLRIRIIGNNAGGSGLVQERTIVGNTAGTTPTITVDAVFTFTPGNGAGYEILSGRVYMLSAGTLAAGVWKYFDVATTSMSGNLSTTNLPATISTDSAIVCLDELHTPITANGVTINGDVGGYFGSLTSTGTAATTITGTVAGADSAVLANEYRNFQIRIVEDTVTPTAVGQRRRITSHTAGASPVYTVPAWTVTPTLGAKFMIENNNDIILSSSASTTIYTYDAVLNTWSTTTYGVRSGAIAAGGCGWHPFNRTIDPAKNVRYSMIYFPRGGGSAVIDMLDIAAGTNGVWTADIAYDNKGLVLWSTGGCSAYDPVSNKTITLPISVISVQNSIYAFDNDGMSLGSYSQMPQVSSTAVAGHRLAINTYVDGTDKKSFVYHIPATTAVFLRSLIFV